MPTFPSDVELPKVEIHVTEVCNNRCAFCTTGWINAEEGPKLVHVPRETIRAQLEKAYAEGARRALFQGGEPTIRRDLGDLLADAHALGYQATTIFTNARMGASKAGARWLVGMKVTWFQVSIQGGTAEAHDASVVAEGAFQQTVEGTRRLIEMGQRVKINAVLTRHLLDSLESFARLMIELRPEEVGMDTVKPTSAFGESRAGYADLAPALGPYAGALRDAVLAMHEAGIVVRLTSFPPCLCPGIERFVSEEAKTTITHGGAGVPVNKLLWKRSMQVKAETCAECAYDATCGGVYGPYAEAHGNAELKPLKERVAPLVAESAPPVESALTLALRALFVREKTRGPFRIAAVRALAGGAHELDCVSPGGAVCVSLKPASEGAAYAKTGRFAVSYRKGGEGASPDLRIVDAVVQALRKVEGQLPPG
jgi:pyruvate-formate lyase-activating enzyme